LSELLTSRNQPINELAALLGKNPVGGSGSNPAQFSTPNLSGVDQIGAANADYSNQLGLYNAGVSSDNATKSAIASLLAAFATGSDRRLKTKIQRVGTSRKGFPLYIFQYLASPGEWELGVMAYEVPSSMKFRHYDGFWRVDYSKVWA